MLPATRQVMDLPLEERRALLEQPGRCFLPIPHYLELSPAVRVELGSPQQHHRDCRCERQAQPERDWSPHAAQVRPCR